MSDRMIQVQFQPTGKRVEVPVGTNLLEAARWAGIELNSTCGGEGTCGQCQVIVQEGRVSEPGSDEVFLLGESEIGGGRHLACRTQAFENVIAVVPRESITTSQRLSIESQLEIPEGLQPDAVVRAYSLRMQKPTLTDVRSDLSRVADALREAYGIPALHSSATVLRDLSGQLRLHNWQVTAFVRAEVLVGVGPFGQKPLGYYVDLGTTKIAVSLVDLETGKTLASAGAPNPQLGYGEDVISRINQVQRSPENAAILSEKVQSTLDHLLGELVAQVGAERSQVVEGVIAGNTVMIHLLLRLPVRQLAYAPYVAVVSDSVEMPSSELGLRMAPGATVYIPPSVGGFIGSDHIAMMLACDLDRSSKVTLGIDIGTNTEVVLSKPGQRVLSSASCASGPAFEGAHIREGMRASSGAIERVTLTDSGLKFSTIEDEMPVGLCGSGIIDITAELYRWNLINRQGTFQRDSQRIRQGKNGGEFLLVPAAQSGTGRDIVIDQKDINEIQLAKGAIHAGLQVLLNTTATALEEVEEVIIAGAFGSYIDIDQAITIGLFPKLPKDCFKQVGNAALVGAHWLLISQRARERAEALRNSVQYMELTNNPRFNRIFALGMLFPNQGGKTLNL